MGTTVASQFAAILWTISLSRSGMPRIPLDGEWKYKSISRASYRCRPCSFGENWIPFPALECDMADCGVLFKALDVAKGVQYLHNENIIHGDLKGVRQIPIII